MFHRCHTLLPFLTLLRIPAAGAPASGAVAERANPERANPERANPERANPERLFSFMHGEQPEKQS